MFKQPPAFHAHPQSLDTGSSPEAFIKREKELGSSSITCTDHGTLGAVRLISRLANKNGLIPLIGIEGYLRDDDCKILKNAGITKDDKSTFKSYNKYYHFTCHFKDFKAYQAASRLLSDAPNERHGTEHKPIFNWEMLSELCSQNITAGSGCLIGVVARHLINNRFDIAEEYYKKYRSLVRSGDFYVEVFPHICDKKWVEGVFFTFNGKDSAQYKFHPNKKLRTEKGEFSAEEIARSFNNKSKSSRILAVKNYNTWEELDLPEIQNAQIINDFIPNESTPYAPDGDLQLLANKFLIKMAKKYGDKIVPSLDAHIAYPEDKIVQDVRLTNSVTGHSWKFANNYYILSSNEIYNYFKSKLNISEKEYEKWVDNGLEVVDKVKNFKFDNTISLPARFYPDDSLGYLKSLIDKHKRMNWDNQLYINRLKQEIELFQNNGTMDLMPYFFMTEDIASYVSNLGYLRGPGRGSAGGVLISYLLGITDLDPIKLDLSLDRFLTLDRIKLGKLPDIDLDFSTREPLVGLDGYLTKRFGEHFAQIATNTSFRTKSAIKDIDRALHGKVRSEIEEVCRGIPTPPQGISDEKFVFGYKNDDGHLVPGLVNTNKSLQKYIKEYPYEWSLVSKFYGISRGFSQHASAFAIANEPIKDLMQLLPTDGHNKVTSFIDDDVEEAGVIKVDLLIVNSIKDIDDCLKILAKRQPIEQGVDRLKSGELIFENKVYNIWDLPEKQEVFNNILLGNTETCFQINTVGAQKWLKYWHCNKYKTDIPLLSSIQDLAIFTALDRPGALDAYVENEDGSKHNMMIEYIKRMSENELQRTDSLLLEILPETKGLMVFQEGLAKVFKQIGNTTGVEAEAFRSHVGKKQLDKVLEDKQIFLKGATKKIGKQRAEDIFGQMESWARYGFCMAHARSYAQIAYATAFLKHYFPMEWWTAVLCNADKNEVAEKFWNYCAHLVDAPDINLSSDTYKIINGRIKAPIDLLQGIGPAAHAELCRKRPFKDIADFVKKVYVDKEGRSSITRGTVIKMIIGGVMDSLFPENTTFLEKLGLFNTKLVELGVKKKTEPIDEAIINLNSLGRYQLKKSIIPMYGQNITDEVLQKPIIKELLKTDYVNGQQTYYIQIKSKFRNDFPLLNADQLKLITLENTSFTFRAAAIGYVLSAEKFTFNNKSKGFKQEALKITLEVENTRFELVKWEIPNNFKTTDIEGAVVVGLLYMGAGKNNWTLSDYVVAQKPIDI